MDGSIDGDFVDGGRDRKLVEDANGRNKWGTVVKIAIGLQVVAILYVVLTTSMNNNNDNVKKQNGDGSSRNERDEEALSNDPFFHPLHTFRNDTRGHDAY